MNLTDLKTKSTQELIDIAKEIGLENMARSRKQDIIFAVLKRHAKSGEDIYGDGVLEILQDGFGFLRSADSSYLAGPDDIYVSPSQIRRFNLRTGDSISGKIRPPKDSERYFALLKVGEVNFSKPENARHKILFENLTPLFPDERMILEVGNGSSEDLTGRIIDLVAPIGKGLRGLLVAPPKAGKTIMMQNIAQAIITNYPEAALSGHPWCGGRGLHLRRTTLASRAGCRHGDRKSQAPGGAQKGRRHPAGLHHPSGSRLEHGDTQLRQGTDRWCRRPRTGASQTVLRCSA
jgi:transcription termination factor Rho